MSAQLSMIRLIWRSYTQIKEKLPMKQTPLKLVIKENCPMKQTPLKLAIKLLINFNKQTTTLHRLRVHSFRMWMRDRFSKKLLVLVGNQLLLKKLTFRDNLKEEMIHNRGEEMIHKRGKEMIHKRGLDQEKEEEDVQAALLQAMNLVQAMMIPKRRRERRRRRNIILTRKRNHYSTHLLNNN